MMKTHGGKGRNVHPVNFNKELFLKFNLPPLHVMKKTLIPLVVEEKIEVEMKDYVTRTTRKEKLKFISWSSSVGNYRLKEEASHLPIGMFDS